MSNQLPIDLTQMDLDDPQLDQMLDQFTRTEYNITYNQAMAPDQDMSTLLHKELYGDTAQGIFNLETTELTKISTEYIERLD
jgi:hypothetical protein